MLVFDSLLLLFDDRFDARIEGLNGCSREQWSSSPRPQHARPVVVTGAGGIVENAHLPAYALAKFPVLAIADTAPGKAPTLAGQFGVDRAFESVADLVRFAPHDAVYDMAVPAGKVLEVIRELPDGVPVLLQKPMGETLEEARSIREICNSEFTARSI